MTILLKRAHEKPTAEDGERILVERLWPRGLRKENAKIDESVKDIAPSSNLRVWYNYDPAKWLEFKKRYWSELDNHKEIAKKLENESMERKVTFLFGSKEEKLNSASALKSI